MSGPKWTQPQRQAIEDRGGALLVSAAAGSGKTAVLVERAVGMITQEQDPVSAERLLILTFTNAAAEELRSRIAVRLEQELRHRPQDTRLRLQRVQLRRAFIGTIDAFCLQLVREHFSLLGLAPDIGVGDESVLENLRQQALAQAMEEMHASPAFAQFAALYGQARSDAGAEQAVLNLYYFTTTLPQPQNTLAEFAAQYEQEAPLEETLWGRQLLWQGNQMLEEAVQLSQQVCQLAEESEGLEKCRPVLEEDLVRLEELQQAAKQGNWDQTVEKLRLFAPGRLVAGRGDAELREAIKTKRAVQKKLLDDLKKYVFACTVDEYRQDMQQAAPLIAVVCRGAQLFSQLYLEAKIQEKALDFGDFEHFALQLLQGENGERTPLAQRVSSMYDVVMVDEYQDTNELQDALYRCLAWPDGGNLFFVGDAKQSIYRFRQANPNIFLDKKAQWAPYGQSSHPATIDLGHNFRSSQGVIDGVNFLFQRIMSRQLGEITYGDTEKLIAGAPGGLEGRFSVDIIEGDLEQEAAHIARQISEMVAHQIPVQDKEGLRPCQYGDFCLLMRARKHMPVFLEALEQYAIPVVADLSETLLETPEVLPLIAALRAIDNPGDDVSLAAMMLSPVFGFTAQELAALRADCPKGRLYGAVTASSQERFRQFVTQFRTYRTLATEVPVGELCETLADATGYLSAISAMEGGSARKENVQRFMLWAKTTAEFLRGGLSGFIRLLDNGKGPAAPTAKTVPGHISLLTIHKSKGLEFPFVYLCDAAHQFQLSGLSERVQAHTQLGLGLVLRSGDELYPTLPALAIRSRVIGEELSEEMRLLYVALTRAKQHITVSFASKDPEKLLAEKAELAGEIYPGAYGLMRQKNMAAWVLCAVLAHKDGIRLLQKKNIPAPLPVAGQASFSLEVHTPQAGQESLQRRFSLTAQPQPELVEALGQLFAQTPPRQELAKVPAKLSVSALVKSGGESLRKRPSFMYGSGLSAAERGTAQHSFMQYADWQAASRDLPGEMQRLIEVGHLDEVTAKGVDQKAVQQFLQSPLAARILSCPRQLREYDFITSVPASRIQPELGEELGRQQILVQGIADLVLVFAGHAEIVDYKTDGGVSPQQLIQRYQDQLGLYRQALQQRLGVPITKLTIWSFSLAREVDVPIEEWRQRE